MDLPVPNRIPNPNLMLDQAMQPVVAAMDPTQTQNSLLKIGDMQMQKEKWAVQHLLSVYQKMDGEQQERFKQNLFNDPKMITTISKFGDPELLFTRSADTAEEKAGKEVAGAKVKAKGQSEIYQSQEYESGEVARGMVAGRAESTAQHEKVSSPTYAGDLAAEETARAQAQAVTAQQRGESEDKFRREFEMVYAKPPGATEYQYVRRKDAEDQGWKMMGGSLSSRGKTTSPTSYLLAQSDYAASYADYKKKMGSPLLAQQLSSPDPRQSASARLKMGNDMVPVLRNYMKMTARDPNESSRALTTQVFLKVGDYINDEEFRNSAAGQKLYDKLEEESRSATGNPLYELIRFLPGGDSLRASPAEVESAQSMYSDVEQFFSTLVEGSDDAAE